MGDDITIGVTEIVNNIEVTAQPNDQIVDISVTDNADNVTLNITPNVIEINVNKGSSYAKWGDIYGTLSDQTDLQNALNLKANLVGGKVPASELPSYVDDIIEVANYAALPATGEIGKIYVTLDNNKIYRWSGSVYIEIASNSAIWGAITGTLSSQTDLVNALNLRVPYTGATSNVNLGEYGLTSGFLGLDTTPTSTPTGIGTIYWDAANRTAALIDGDGDTTLQIGQEQRILVHNNTGSTLTDGQVVYVTGSTGNLPSVSLANASSETTSAATLGVVTESIANGADGFITTSGIVNGLNTLAFNEGDLLWLGTTAGTFTATKPISPNHLVLIGYVIKKAGGNGSILVKIQNTQELEESSDVLFTSLANNQVLTYESATDLWKNKSIATILGYTPANDSSVVHIAGTETITGIKTFSVDTIVNGVTVGKGGASEAGNTAVGENALSSNTSGILNTAIGFESLLNNTGGGDNTSLGWWSLKSNTTGNSNVSAGTASLANNTTGFGNTSLGWNSLAVSTTGAFNSALGYLAGSSFGGSDSNANTLTSYSIYIGYKAGPLANSQTNQIVIGKNAIGAGSNTVTIGNTDITTTRLRGEIQGGSFKKDGGTSSQFLKADGSVDSTTYQTALTNPVTGTGTTNYIPKFTGASAIGNSLIYDDGTNIGIGTTSPAYKLDINGTFRTKENSLLGENTTVGNSSFAWGFPGANYGQMQNVSSTVYGIGFGSTPTTIGTTVLSYNTSGNVGIGTTSPSSKLHVVSAVGGAGNTLPTNATAIFDQTGNNLISISGGSANEAGIFMPRGTAAYYSGVFRSDTNLLFRNNDAEAMRITSAGNVGIGTTSPSFAIGSGLHVKSNSGWGEIRIEGQSFAGGTGSAISFTSEGTALADIYADTDKNLSFRTNGASERMRILANGNVGIGTTNPVSKLTINTATNENVAIGSLASIPTGRTLILQTSSSGGSIETYSSVTSGYVNTLINPNGGNVGIGTTSPTDGKLQVAGNTQLGNTIAQTYFGVGAAATKVTSNGSWAIGVDAADGSTERMRITSGGNVLIGTTSGNTADILTAKTTTSGYNPFRAVGVTDGIVVQTTQTSGTSYFNYYIYNGSAVGSITSTGSSTSYNTSSDYRLKQDLKPINGLNLVSQIKVYDYEWKLDESRSYGVLAHELQEVIPQAVNGEKDGENMQGVDYSKLVPILVQAIQELKQEIEILKNK